MGRTLGDISMGFDWPSVGSHLCKVIMTGKGSSQNKKTPFVKLTMMAADGKTFEDSAYVTPKTIGRLKLIAMRVCGLTNDFELPDDDMEAAKKLANHINENASGKFVVVTIEEEPYEFIHEDGPDMGKKETRTRKKVAFSGYEATDKTEFDYIDESLYSAPNNSAEPPKSETGDPGVTDDDLPF